MQSQGEMDGWVEFTVFVSSILGGGWSQGEGESSKTAQQKP